MLNFTRFTTPITKSTYDLTKGDVVETGTGLFAFDRFPKGGKNWYGKSMNDGKNYRIRIISYINSDKKIVGSYNFEVVAKAALKSASNDVSNLGKDDLFVIKHGRGNNAELFRYVRQTGRKVVAVNPITNKTFNIDKNFTFTKITNLPY